MSSMEALWTNVNSFSNSHVIVEGISEVIDLIHINFIY